MTDEYTEATALNLFYDEYEDVCEGYTVMIDGIDVGNISDNATTNEILQALLGLTDDEGNYGVYEQNEVAVLYNKDEQTEREEEEQAKDDAPFLVTVDSGDAMAIYVKEGKYIGKTYSDDDDAVSTYTEEDEEGNEVTGPVNYMRIIVKDRDYTVLDNVEEFFDIEEERSSTGIYVDLEAIDENSTIEEKIRAAMSYFIENGFSVEGAAGIVGNLLVETSSLDPTTGSLSSHYGLAQWTASWWSKIEEWGISNGYNDIATSFAGQIRAIYECSDTGYMTDSRWEELQNLTDVEKAAELFCVFYENCPSGAKSSSSGDGQTEWYSLSYPVGYYYQGLANRKSRAQKALEVYYGADYE